MIPRGVLAQRRLADQGSQSNSNVLTFASANVLLKQSPVLRETLEAGDARGIRSLLSTREPIVSWQRAGVAPELTSGGSTTGASVVGRRESTARTESTSASLYRLSLLPHALECLLLYLAAPQSLCSSQLCRRTRLSSLLPRQRRQDLRSMWWPTTPLSSQTTTCVLSSSKAGNRS